MSVTIKIVETIRSAIVKQDTKMAWTTVTANAEPLVNATIEVGFYTLNFFISSLHQRASYTVKN